MDWIIFHDIVWTSKIFARTVCPVGISDTCLGFLLSGYFSAALKLSRIERFRSQVVISLSQSFRWFVGFHYSWNCELYLDHCRAKFDTYPIDCTTCEWVIPQR